MRAPTCTTRSSRGFLILGEDVGGKRGWTPLAIANGLSYADFYTEQPRAAEVLRNLMQVRGLPTEGERIDPVTCLDCIQTHAPVRAAFQEREKKIDALAAATLGVP